MEFRQFLKAVFHQKFFILLMCLSAVITATILTYIVSEKYKSSTIILIRPQKSINLIAKRREILNFPVDYHSPVETASTTYTEIVKSRAIAERVVKRLGLHMLTKDGGSVGFRQKLKNIIRKTKGMLVDIWTWLKYGRLEQEDPFNYLVTRIQKGLKVKPTKKTYLFELEAEEKSPELAPLIANTAAKVLIEYLQEMDDHERAGALQLSEEKFVLSKHKLNQARNTLREFKEVEEVVSIREETILQLRVLSELEDAWKKVDTEIKGALAKKEEIEKQLVGLEVFTKSSEKIAENFIFQNLQLELAQKGIALAGLQEQYKPEHLEIEKLKVEINEIKKKLKEQSPTLNSEVIMTANPIYQNILQEKVELEIQLKSLKAKRDDLTLSILEKKAIIDQLPHKEARLANLELAVNLEEQTYTSLSKELDELKITTKQDVPDIRLIYSAVPPLYPHRPIKIYHAGLAAILSLICGIGIVLLKEHMNLNIRSIYEAEQGLGLPVLSTVPKLTAAKSQILPLMVPGRKSLPEVNRRKERVCIRSAVNIKGVSDPEGIKGDLIDISLCGACIKINTECKYKPKDMIDIEIESLKKKFIVRASIIRTGNAFDQSDSSTIAVNFGDIDEPSSQELKRLIQSPTYNPHFSLLPPAFEESIHKLRFDLNSFAKASGPSFIITSCGPREGKSTIAVNLAMALIAINKNILLIDANLRNPVLHQIFNLPNNTGLLNILLEDIRPPLKKVTSGLNILTSGQAVKDPSALLGSERMRRFIERSKKDFDFVLIDTYSLLSGPDAASLTSPADGVILVLDAGRTVTEDGKRAKEIVEKAEGKILGTIINKYNKDFDDYTFN